MYPTRLKNKLYTDIFKSIWRKEHVTHIDIQFTESKLELSLPHYAL